MKRIYFLLMLLLAMMQVAAENYMIRVYSDGCSSPQTILAAAGEQLSLTAAPENQHYHFKQWSDGNTSNPRLVTVSQDATYTAQFAPEYYTLSIMASGCQAPTVLIAPYGEQVTITATADADYHFTQWNDGNTDNPRVVSVSGNVTYAAQFAPNTVTITTSANYAERGVTVGDTTVLLGDTVVIAATANYGYHFVQWSDGNAANPREVVADANKQFTAVFDKNVYRIQKLAVNGSVSGVDSALYLDQVTLTAKPLTGYYFTQWSDGNESNPRSFTLTQDTLFEAQFARQSYTITTNVNYPERGEIVGDTLAFYLDTVLLTATANYGYHFVQWSDGNAANPREVVADANKQFTAQFDKNVYLIQKLAVNGSVSGLDSALYLDQVTLTAKPATGYYFTQWSDGNESNPRSFTLTQDTLFEAQFARKSYTITTATSDASMGSVQGGATVLYQDTITLTAIPTTGYQFNQWSDGNTENPRTVVVTGDKTYTAQFGTKMCRLTLQSNIMEAADLTGAGIYAYGTTVTCSYDLMSGYEFVKWSNGKTYNPYKFKIYDDMTLTAFFQEENSTPAPSNTVVTPADNNANIQWPQVDNAYTYTLVIRSGGEVVCTLTFNAIGQLVNIDFGGAPARSQQSTQAIGFNFTITGLQPGTTYDYELIAKDEQGQQVKTETGTFTTTGTPTALDEAEVATTATKFIRNGKLFILRNGILYNAAGQVVK